MHRPVPAAQDPVEMVALAPVADQSRGGTTAMGAEAPRRDATPHGAIPERHPSQRETVRGDTTRRGPHVGNRTVEHAAHAPEPAEPVLDGPAAATGYRHVVSKHPGVRRRSAPPR